MRTEKEKMLAGELYDPFDPELVRARERARDLCQDLNATRGPDQEARRRILTALFGQGGESVSGVLTVNESQPAPPRVRPRPRRCERSRP